MFEMDAVYNMSYDELMELNHLVATRLCEERTNKIKAWNARLQELLNDIQNNGAFIELTEDKFEKEYLSSVNLCIHF